MTDSPLRELEACGVSIWNDNISRTWLEQGGLKKLIDDDGISGVTSNPTIFEKAIGGSSDYDKDLDKLAREGLNAEQIFQRLAVTDIGMAADDLRRVYDQTGGADGFVSIEVSPDAAHDTDRTLEDAHYFWNALQRPNIMIKVPATPEGIPAVEQLIYEGINVNITLIFAVEVYEDVMEAYVKGLERRAQEGKPLDCVASVASFFVSRVDTLVDKLLEQKMQGADGSQGDQLKSLEGRAAVANAKIAYERFQKVFSGDRWDALKSKGARVQRPLWASTSTKNPAYRDTMYVEDLVGRDTVNTMPPQTIDAVRDHGKIQCDTVTQDVQGAHDYVQSLSDAGINMTDVTDQLTREGVESFAKSLHSLYDTIAEKSQRVTAGAGSK